MEGGAYARLNRSPPPSAPPATCAVDDAWRPARMVRRVCWRGYTIGIAPSGEARRGAAFERAP